MRARRRRRRRKSPSTREARDSRRLTDASIRSLRATRRLSKSCARRLRVASPAGNLAAPGDPTFPRRPLPAPFLSSPRAPRRLRPLISSLRCLCTAFSPPPFFPALSDAPSPPLRISRLSRARSPLCRRRQLVLNRMHSPPTFAAGKLRLLPSPSRARRSPIPLASSSIRPRCFLPTFRLLFSCLAPPRATLCNPRTCTGREHLLVGEADFSSGQRHRRRAGRATRVRARSRRRVGRSGVAR